MDYSIFDWNIYINYFMRQSKKISAGFEGEQIIDFPKKILFECTRLPLISQLYISRMGIFPQAANHYFRRPLGGSSFAVFLHCFGGEGWIKIDNKYIGLKSGEAFFIPPAMAHSYGASPNKPWSIFWMHIAGNKNRDLINIVNLKGYQEPIKTVYSEERTELFNNIFEIFSKGFSKSNLIYANLVLPHYLGTFISPDSFSSLSKDSTSFVNTINDAIIYMQENIAKKITVESISKYLCLSSSFFFKKFKHDTGYPPIAYFNFLKIQKACQLIHSNRCSISEIGSKIGIDDPYYFSRLFKKQMGVSPREYKKYLYSK